MRRHPALSLCAAAVAAVAMLPACGSSAAKQVAPAFTTVPGPYDFDYEIPKGTFDAVAAGKTVNVLPEVLDAKVGQSIRIVNRDAVNHEIGAWFVLANTTFTYRFNKPGNYSGVCTTHVSKQFTLHITA